MKKARDNATDTTQPDLGSMSLSINTFSIAEFVEEYNEDFNKNGSLGSQPLDNTPPGSQLLDNMPLGSQLIDKESALEEQLVDIEEPDQAWIQEQLLVEQRNPVIIGETPRHKKWPMFARPCLTCDEDTHCQKNCTKELQNLKDLAREEPEYQSTVWDFLAGMPFEYNLQGEVVGCMSDNMFT